MSSCSIAFFVLIGNSNQRAILFPRIFTSGGKEIAVNFEVGDSDWLINVHSIRNVLIDRNNSNKLPNGKFIGMPS